MRYSVAESWHAYGIYFPRVLHRVARWIFNNGERRVSEDREAVPQGAEFHGCFGAPEEVLQLYEPHVFGKCSFLLNCLFLTGYQGLKG